MPRPDCAGRADNDPCVFGQNGTAIQPTPPQTRCMWCDKERSKADMLVKSKHKIINKMYRRMSAAIQEKALEYVEPQYHTHFKSLKYKCQGYQGKPCIFAKSATPKAATVPAMGIPCFFCNVEELRNICNDREVSGLHEVAWRLRQVPVSSQKVAWKRIPDLRQSQLRLIIEEMDKAKKAKTSTTKKDAIDDEEFDTLDQIAAETDAIADKKFDISNQIAATANKRSRKMGRPHSAKPSSSAASAIVAENPSSIVESMSSSESQNEW